MPKKLFCDTLKANTYENIKISKRKFVKTNRVQSYAALLTAAVGTNAHLLPIRLLALRVISEYRKSK